MAATLEIVDADGLSAVGSISSVVVAIGAGIVSFFAWRASANSAKAASALTAIEKARLHAEMLPQIKVTAETLGALDKSDDDGSKVLYVKLLGPPALVQLDSIIVKLQPLVVPYPLDDGKWAEEENWPYLFSQEPPGGPYSTEEKIGAIMVGQRRGCFMVTPPESDWVTGVADDEVEVVLTCHREGYEPWIVPAAVKIPTPRRRRKSKPGEPTDA